eukprot:Phypoly_transcript_18745.p1 GENE.Phypoly_transcript_18745~~Phypoly_transcript_18745.p1  ORF type:complete len:249 (+),score=16.75 Phypoly_transcript_18745:54-749(+)
MEHILLNIVEFLPIQSIISLYMLNQSHSRLFHDKNIWQILIRKDFSYCQGKTCAFMNLPPLLHYHNHHSTNCYGGLGLHLSASRTRISIGDRLSITTTIFNTSYSPMQLEVGHSLVGIYYENGGLFRIKWKRGHLEERRRATFSTTSAVLSGTPIIATIAPHSFVQYTTTAKLRDMSLKKPKKWSSWNETNTVLCFPKYHLPIPRDHESATLHCVIVWRRLKSNKIKIQVM